MKNEPSKLFEDYNSLLNQRGMIISGKRGMNWSRMVKPVMRFSFKNFFYKRLKEFDGPNSNLLPIAECINLAKEHNLKLNEVDNTSIVTFAKI